MATWRAIAVVMMGLASLPVGAAAQVTVAVPANPGSLGAIPDTATTGICGVPRDVTFTVAASVAIRTVTVSMTVSHTIDLLRVHLIAPSGSQHRIFSFVPYSSILQGTYVFTDAATSNFYVAAGVHPNSVIPPGQYRTELGPTPSSIDAAFAGELSAGTWTLRFENCKAESTGAVSAGALVLNGVPTTVAPAVPSTLGSIPDGPTMAAQSPGPPRDVTFVVPANRGTVESVLISMSLRHARVGDVVARLITPNGQSHVLFGYTGATTSGAGGLTSGLNGTYEFVDGSLLLDWWAVATVDDPVISGTYTTSEIGGPGSVGAVTSMDAVFADAPSAGVWTLRLTDGSAGATGTISAASLTIQTRATPTTVADTYGTAYATPLSVAAPGLLANDTDNFGGAMTAVVVTGPANGTVSLASSGGFSYTPNVGFFGTDTFTYRASTASGPGNTATVSIAVAAPTTVQPPTALVASAIVGNQVTLRWTPSAVGPAPTDYVIEGGVAPGQTLGGAAVGLPLPILTFPAPTGVFYVRVHAMANGQRSGPSNEIQIVVNTPAPPSAPDSLTGLVSGNSLTLRWRNTFGGGSPASNIMDVTGGAIAALPVPLTETFAFTGVPGGTYTFRARAANASGTSLGSNPVTLTFPNGCSGVPLPPANFLAYALGNVVHLVWDPSVTGPAAAGYVLHVGGAYSGSLPFTSRSFSTPAPSGAYTFNVVAVNACGASSATATQTVFVP